MLHRDPLATGPLVVLGHGEDEVAELAEAGVGAVGRLLAAVEVDRPAAEGDRGGRPALGADDAGRPRRWRPGPAGPAPGRRPARRRPPARTPRPSRRACRRRRRRGRRGRSSRRIGVSVGRGPSSRPRAAVAGRSAVERGPLDADRRRPRGARAGRTSAGAGPSRPRRRARPPGPAPTDRGSIACHSAAMATAVELHGQRDRRRFEVPAVQPARPGRALRADPLERRPARTTTRRLGRGPGRGRRPGPRRRPARRPP